MRGIGWISILFAQAILWLGLSESNLAMAQGQSKQATTGRAVTGYWTHNGSVMSLVADGKTQKFIYHTPRVGLLDAGVKPGTLLFEGRRSGQTFTGTAYQFYRTCKPRGFRVSGSISDDQKQIIFKGKAPLLDVNCQLAGTRDDVLVFTASTAPTTELAAKPKATDRLLTNVEERADHGPEKQPKPDSATATKSETARAAETSVAETRNAKVEELPSQTSSAIATTAQTDAATAKPGAPQAEPQDAAVAPDKPPEQAQIATVAAVTGAAATEPPKENPSTAPAVAAETSEPADEKAGVLSKPSGDAVQAEAGQIKPPAVAAVVKDATQTGHAKAEAESPAVGNQTPKTGEVPEAGTAPSRQPPPTVRTEPAESKVAAPAAPAGGNSSQADDPGKAKAATQEVAVAVSETKQEEANSAGIAGEQSATPPQAETGSAKVAAVSSAAVATVATGDDTSKAKAASGEAAGSLQTALTPPPSSTEGDRTGGLGESRGRGMSQGKAAVAPAAEMMEIVLRNGRILRISRDVDLEVLARIVTVLER